MRINTNVSALNAQRQLGITNQAVSNSITKLSSGFRINRAADDAAGLGIANKLRGDIRSMTQAARNGEQANSLAQIAEGAVSGIAKMLDRMKELATQANSDTVDLAGRQRLQAEFKALRDEIGRTADTTKFGSATLIDGTMGNTVDAASTALTVASRVVEGVSLSGTAAATYTLTNSAAGALTITGGGKSQTISLAQNGAQKVDFDVFGLSLQLNSNWTTTGTANPVGTIIVDPPSSGNAGSFMVGSSGSYGTDDLLHFSRINMSTATGGLNLVGLNLEEAVGHADGARAALTRIDGAISKVNEALGSIGAFQNRIENAIANLKTGIENLSASESVIRDLDMASEMTTFSRNQILAQAGTAMLAQANQSSQNVLQLLRG
jgi:flagellin